MTNAKGAEKVAAQSPLRSPETVMKLERMGAFFPTRLSFMRTTIRRLAREKAEIRRPVWQINKEGFGRAVYSLEFGGDTYSLVAFSTRIPEEKRTDRVIAEMWDTTYVLFDGEPVTADLDRLEKNAPRQEAGRFLASELVLCRANKSVRLFEHVVESLAAGRQPDEKMIGDIGYLMRTTAVYGNGKFGIADRVRIRNRPALRGPFQAEMLTVWLIRNFTHDLVNHVARERSLDTAVPLARHIRRNLGIGNSTGLGMAPYLVSHPVLMNNWMQARETALARVRELVNLSSAQTRRFAELAKRVSLHLDQWNVEDKRQMDRVLVLRSEWQHVLSAMDTALGGSHPVNALLALGEDKSIECQELLFALAIEPFGDLVDDLETRMASDVEPRLDPAMPLGELAKRIERDYAWALKLDLSNPVEARQFWYVSEEKLEPRLGNRFEEEGAERELPHDIARQIQELKADIEKESSDESTARFLMKKPEHRFIARRIQTVALYPYAEIRDNLVGEKCLPIDMLRCKLAFFGASKFDPKSDRWTRINMYQGAPLSDEMSDELANPVSDADDWWLPVLEGPKETAGA